MVMRNKPNLSERRFHRHAHSLRTGTGNKISEVAEFHRRSLNVPVRLAAQMLASRKGLEVFAL